MDQRGSGILFHITSLPAPYGVGDLGPEAYQFVDFLARTKQRYWQVLPLNPTDPLYGNSPYSGLSAFAGNPLLISPDLLVSQGLLSAKDLHPLPSFPPSRCDFPKAIRYKNKLLAKAYQQFTQQEEKHPSFDAFCSENSFWIENFSLFMVLKNHFKGKLWNRWPKEFKDRSLTAISVFRKEFHDLAKRVKFLQYLFFTQWLSLKDYAATKGVILIGDLSLYVGMDSSDTWSNSGLFKLDIEKKPAYLSGVPPDYFSKTGQMWGTPVYDWEVLKETGYAWWIKRFSHNLKLFDMLRLDHFRGLVAHWEIPAGEKTAIHGKWVDAPANDFLSTLKRAFPLNVLIAEDLGAITPDVRNVLKRFKLPGMKILQFAFTEDCAEPSHFPHHFEKKCWVYTGTHDNNTTRGWFEEEASSRDRRRLFHYLGKKVSLGEIHWALIRLAMMSVAESVLFPLQDVLGLGSEARMNRPATAVGNWEWRLTPGQITPRVTETLRELTETYGRCLN